ncbi:MAG: hypothetical protein R2940_08245 [Syntrophotaleaceae bacterium]
MKRILTNLCLLAAVLFSVTAFAGEESAPSTFQTLDVDQDGYISGQEAASSESLNQEFKKVDANQDGKLDEAEFAAFEPTEKQN